MLVSQLDAMREALEAPGEGSEACRKESFELVSTLRREAQALISTSSTIGEVAASYEEDFPALGTTTKVTRIRSRVVTERSKAGDITRAPGPSSSGDVMAAAMSRRLDNAKVASSSMTTPQKKSKISTSPRSSHSKEEDGVVRRLAAIFARVGGFERLGSTLKLLCSMLDRILPSARVESSRFLRDGSTGLFFASVAVCRLRAELGAAAGAEAVRGALRRIEDERTRLILATYAERLEEAGTTKNTLKISKESSGDDYSQPFVRERDSRKEFERDAEGRASFENRERARDAFLQLLRDFKSAQSAVNDQSMAALVPNEDRLRVYLPPIASPSQRGRQKGKGRGDETLRSRASGVVRDLLPSNQEWFARFFDATVVRVALSRDLNADYQKLRKLEARFEHTKTTVEGPHSVFGHDEQFFALFVAAADAALFRHHLLGTLADAIRADLRDLESNNKFDTLDRVAVRSRLVAFLVCLPYYATARRNTPAPTETRVAWPVDLDPETLFFVESSLVTSTDVALPKNGDSGSLELAAGKIFCATHLCRALKWTTSKKIDAIDAARLAARSLAERREVSAHAVFARLEIERLFDDLRLDVSLFSPTTVLCFGEDDSASTSPPTQTPRKMYALSPLALDNTPERQREQSVPRTQLDVPALTIRAEYAAQIKASFSTKATQASPAAPSSKRKKLRPFLLVAPVLDDDTPDLFAPLADCFFRRYPLLKQAAELALDAATAHATDLPGEEALAVAKDKLSTLIKFAPPDAPEKLVEVASNLALQRFERSVLPGLLHKMHLRTHESSLLPDDEEADSSHVDASTQHVGGGRDGADAKGRARVALTNITAIPARADIQREDSSPHQRRHPVPSQQIKRFLLPPETPPRALSESASRSSPPPPPVFNIEQNLANFGSDAQPAEVERTVNVLQPRVNVLQPRAREG